MSYSMIWPRENWNKITVAGNHKLKETGRRKIVQSSLKSHPLWLVTSLQILNFRASVLKCFVFDPWFYLIILFFLFQNERMLDPDQNGNNQSPHINNVNSLYTTNRGKLLYFPPLFSPVAEVIPAFFIPLHSGTILIQLLYEKGG